MEATRWGVNDQRPQRVVVVALLAGALLSASGCALDDSGFVAVQRPIDAPAGLDILFGHCAPGSDAEIGTDRLTDIDVRVESEPATAAAPEPSALDDPVVDESLPDFRRTAFDRIVWSVHADVPTRLDSVRVGSEPPGFSTVVPLEEPLPNRVLIVARSAGGSRSDDGVAELSVVLANAPADGTFVLDENGTTTLEEFRERVRTDGCSEALTEDGRSTLGSSLSSLLVRLLLLTGGLLAVIAAVLVWLRSGVDEGDGDEVVDGGHPTSP